MSPYLNIPLSRHQKTTRRPRWVVWLLGVLTIIGVGFFWQISVIWFTTPEAFKAAPEGTHTGIQLFVNKRTLPILSEMIGQIPLISNRNLTLSEFASFTRGEMVWFLDENGSRSVAVRTQQRLLPTKLLDENHIVIQKVTSNIFLLSEKLQPISGLRIRRSFSSLLPSFSTHIGAFADSKSKKVTKITHKNRQLTVDLPFAYPEGSTFHPGSIPEGGYLILLTPVLTKQNSENQMQRVFSSLTEQFIFDDLLSSRGLILLKNAKNPSFLIASEQNIEENARISLIQTALALKYPSKQQKVLKDQTISQELIFDPSLISVEQRIVLGRGFHHATVGTTSLFISKDNDIVMSNDEELLKNWLNTAKNKNVSDLCNANVAYLSVKELLESNLYPTDVYTHDIFPMLAKSIREIGLERSGKSAKLHLCY